MPQRNRLLGFLSGIGLAGIAAWVAAERQGRKLPPMQPAGEPETAGTRSLERGAERLQHHLPLRGFDTYVVGFHPQKDDPERQWEVHHYCRQVNEDFSECVLFDGNNAAANLIGVEYIISERLFERLPEEERGYWHPHNGEILSGQLIAPGLPEAAEHALMRKKLNSYGKTWRLWDTGADDRSGFRLPLGEPVLAWAFTRDGEVHPWLIDQRDRRMGLDTAAKRSARADLVAEAHPQEGVDAIRDRYPGPTAGIPGVREDPDNPNRR